jgi:two-component system nitrate/nitrite response regulator NarP
MGGEVCRRSLRPRQEEVLSLVCSGKRNKEIALQLGVSERTVKWYIAQLLLIFGASNRTELTVLSRHQHAK